MVESVVDGARSRFGKSRRNDILIRGTNSKCTEVFRRTKRRYVITYLSTIAAFVVEKLEVQTYLKRQEIRKQSFVRTLLPQNLQF